MDCLKIGKVPNKLLKELVIGKMKYVNDRVLLSGAIGEDFGVLDFGGECCIVSGDPITGTTKHAGKTAVYVACNDIATCGVRPVAILTTLLLPPGTKEDELGALADEIAMAAATLGVGVIGGHTEVTDAVNRIVISVTAIGAAERGRYVTTGGAGAGDALVMTKSAGIEGAAIIAAEREGELLKRFGSVFIDEAKKLSDNISVVGEGVIAGEFGVKAMHDATEGGVYGAAWEMAEASGKGVVLYKDRIKVLDVTRDICAYFNIDAYRLISSGSMLIATDKPRELIDELGGSGIHAAEIGVFLENPGDRVILSGEAGRGAATAAVTATGGGTATAAGTATGGGAVTAAGTAAGTGATTVTSAATWAGETAGTGAAAVAAADVMADKSTGAGVATQKVTAAGAGAAGMLDNIEGAVIPLEQPGPDELYKVINGMIY